MNEKPASERIRLRVAAEAIGLVYQALPKGVVGTLMHIAVLTPLLWDHVPKPALLAWLALAGVLLAVRIGLTRAYLRADPAPWDAAPWVPRVRWFASLSGAWWGCGIYLLPPGDRSVQGMLFILCVYGMFTGAIPTYAPVKGLFRAYYLPMVLPLIAWTLPPLDGYAWAASAIFFSSCLWSESACRRIRNTLDEALRLRFENLALMEDLEASNADLSRSAAQLTEARERAEAATLAKSEFLASMSHEIRTPMNAIQGFSQLGQKLELSPKALDYFRKIATASRSLLGIINDILDFSKVEAGKLELDARPFRLDQVTGNLRDLFAQPALEKGLDFSVTVAPGTPEVLAGDSLRLGQVLINLTGNAIKFTSAGSVRVVLSAQPDESDQVWLRAQVQDTGIGLTEAQLGRLFQPFSQAEASTQRTFGGTGLGLAISRRIVELMGGELTVASTPGQGSLFAFRVPLARANEAAPDEPRAAPTEARRLSALRILVVEDNAINQEVAREILRGWGIEPCLASSGPEALGLVKSEGFDVVLMDVQMPGMDGLETTRRIRALAGLSQLPILALTANAMEQDRAACQEAGMNDFISKPIEPEDLLSALQRWGPPTPREVEP